MTDDLISRDVAKACLLAHWFHAPVYHNSAIAVLNVIPAADLSSPLGVVAMRDVASAVVAGMAPFYIGETRFADHASLAKQIANIPLPDHETLLAVAMNLPEVAALRKALHFYADFYENPNEGPWGVNSEDFGKVARTALEARHRKESLHLLD